MSDLTPDQIIQFRTEFPESATLFQIDLETLTSDQAVEKLNQVKKFLGTLKEKEIQYKAKAEQLGIQRDEQVNQAKAQFECNSLDEAKTKLVSLKNEIQTSLQNVQKTLEV